MHAGAVQVHSLYMFPSVLSVSMLLISTDLSQLLGLPLV